MAEPLAAIYTRVSSEEQAERGFSLADQRRACLERAGALGLTVPPWLEFCDAGVPGDVLDRPGLRGLREAVRARAAAAVVILDPDRLARKLSLQLLVTEEIDAAGIRLEFVQHAWRADAEGRLFYALRGAIAEFEREKIRDRTVRGRLQRARSGRLPSGFRPYGYEYDAAAGSLRPSAREAAVVRFIFDLAATGQGPAAIARRLDALGVAPRRAAAWRRQVIRQILANPVYRGDFAANRFDCARVHKNRFLPAERRQRVRRRPEAEWIHIPVPALVSEPAWAAAQAALRRARRLWAGRPPTFYLLSGLLRCVACDRPMHGHRRGERRAYACPGCGRRIAADRLEAAIWGELARYLADPGRLRRTALREGGQGPAVKARAAARRQVRAARARLLDLVAHGLADTAEVAPRLAALARQAERLEQPAAPGQAPPRPLPPAGWDPGSLPAEARRRALRAVVREIAVRDGTVEVRAYLPPQGGGPPGRRP